MRKLMAGMLLAALAGGASAQLQLESSGVFDPNTGLTWSYLTPVIGASAPPLTTFTDRTDGQRLATAAELLTFFADSGLSPLSGIYQSPLLTPYEPPGLVELIQWSAGSQQSVHSGYLSNFIYAVDQPGYVGTGYISDFYALNANYQYSAFLSPSNSLYMQQFNPGNIYGAALVQAIPEPSTYILLALGFGSLALLRRFKKT